MKRKYFSALLMGALTIASVSTFTSCKDYDDDISNLQQQIDSNAKAIETIQNLIKGGGLVTGVTDNSDGVTVTLSDGKSVTISMVRMALLVLHGLSVPMATGMRMVKRQTTWLAVLRARKARRAIQARRVKQAQAHPQHLMSTLFLMLNLVTSTSTRMARR